uniref:Peptidase M24 domain-containing protein n=1 Tax=Paramoeba aestuarina TaxID=180227 RepID=A0A7S4UPN8_9EUKA
MNIAIAMSKTPGVTTKDICLGCDAHIQTACEKVYIHTVDPVTKGTLAKGICFPTCVSLNEIVCHYSSSNIPLHLKTDDIVRISMGCQIDGYPVMAGHTFRLTQNTEDETTVMPTTSQTLLSHRRLSLIHACDEAMKAVVAAFRPGAMNTDIAGVIAKIANKYNVQVLPNALSHEMKRYILNGRNVIVNRDLLATLQRDAHEFEVQENQVYHIDVVFGMLDNPSLSNGKICFPSHVAHPTERGEQKVFDLVPSDEHDCTVFVRNVTKRPIRLQTANTALTTIKHQFLTFPFRGYSIFPDSLTKSKIAINSLVENSLIDTLPVLTSKKHMTAARFCCTILVTKKETVVLAGNIEDAERIAEVESLRKDTSVIESTKALEHNDNLTGRIFGPVEALLKAESV